MRTHCEFFFVLELRSSYKDFCDTPSSTIWNNLFRRKVFRAFYSIYYMTEYLQVIILGKVVHILVLLSADKLYAINYITSCCSHFNTFHYLYKRHISLKSSEKFK